MPFVSTIENMAAMENTKIEFSELSNRVIGCAIEVHKALGSGLLESAYHQALCHELRLNGIGFEKEKSVPVFYKDCQLGCGYRVDILVENEIILELKTVREVAPKASIIRLLL